MYIPEAIVVDPPELALGKKASEDNPATESIPRSSEARASVLAIVQIAESHGSTVVRHRQAFDRE